MDPGPRRWPKADDGRNCYNSSETLRETVRPERRQLVSEKKHSSPISTAAVLVTEGEGAL